VLVNFIAALELLCQVYEQLDPLKKFILSIKDVPASPICILSPVSFLIKVLKY